MIQWIFKSSNLYSSNEVSGGGGQPLSRNMSSPLAGADHFLSSRAAINDGRDNFPAPRYPEPTRAC
jgi:hypothetical protein